MELIIQGDLYVLTHDSLRFSWDHSTSWSLFVDNKELDPALEGEAVLGLCGNMDGNSQSEYITLPIPEQSSMEREWASCYNTGFLRWQGDIGVTHVESGLVMWIRNPD